MSSPQLPLYGRVALVTGVSRFNGIGFAVARRLGRMGTSLFLHGWPEYDRQMSYVREGEPLGHALIDALRHEGLTVAYGEHDFMDPEGPERVMRAAVETYGHVDIVDANHAYSIDDRLETLDYKVLDRPASQYPRDANVGESVRGPARRETRRSCVYDDLRSA